MSKPNAKQLMALTEIAAAPNGLPDGMRGVRARDGSNINGNIIRACLKVGWLVRQSRQDAYIAPDYA